MSHAQATGAPVAARAWFVGTGLRCPLGLNAPQSSFLYRAGASGLRESAVLSPDGEPATMGVYAPLDPYLQGAARLEALGVAALEEALAPIATALSPLRTKLTLLLDEPIGCAPTLTPDTVGTFRRAAYALLGNELAVESVEGGGGAVARVLSSALEQFDSGELDCLVLGGLHTDYSVERVRWLHAEGRLYSPDTSDALLPGEGAGFVVLLSTRALGHSRLTPLGGIIGVAHAVEKARFDNDESAFEAGALTLVIRKATEAVAGAGQRLGWLFSDVNLETFRIHELQAVTTRIQHLFGPPQWYDMPTQKMGELGAAAPCVHAVLGIQAWLGRHAPAGAFLSVAGSDGGARSAMVVYQS